MKRHLSDPRNPGVYALLIRSGMEAHIKRKHLPSDQVERFKLLLGAAAHLYQAGVLTVDEYEQTMSRIRRQRAAAVLKAYRRDVAMSVRTKVLGELRAACGMLSSFQVRMGYSHA